MECFVPRSYPGEHRTGVRVPSEDVPRSVPDVTKRIYSIRYTHDGAEWTATVGEELRGTRTRKRPRKEQVVEVTEQLSDPATVLAIFAGSPYMVTTNARLAGARSAWENPFMTGQPNSITYFDPPAETSA